MGTELNAYSQNNQLEASGVYQGTVQDPVQTDAKIQKTPESTEIDNSYSITKQQILNTKVYRAGLTQLNKLFQSLGQLRRIGGVQLLDKSRVQVGGTKTQKTVLPFTNLEQYINWVQSLYKESVLISKEECFANVSREEKQEAQKEFEAYLEAERNRTEIIQNELRG